jgi:hypothetical protein
MDGIDVVRLPIAAPWLYVLMRAVRRRVTPAPGQPSLARAPTRGLQVR